VTLIKRIVLFNSVFIIFYSSCLAQSAGWIDPALSHNKLVQNQIEGGGYHLIGPYKVTGTSFLFGERLPGDIFSTNEKAYNIFLNYNTYNQEVGFFSTANPSQSLVKVSGTLDSFIIRDNVEIGIEKRMKFIYGPLLGTNDKFYYQELYPGQRYSLYKKYRSDLGIVSSNYVQSELRKFDLLIDYYYYNSEMKDFTKLKFNLSNIIKEFKSIKNLSLVMNKDDWAIKPEKTLIKAFAELNK